MALDRLMQFLQNAAAPCALFTLGVTVALRPLKKMPWEVPFLTAVKLMLHPVLVFLLLSLFGPFDRTWVYTAVLMAALPPALNVFVFARQYDAWVEQASSAVLVGTLVSVVTLTSVMWMVKTGALPALLFRYIMQPLSAFWCSISPRCCRGRWPGLMLAEAGAEVIKIERPGGEDARRFRRWSTDESVTFALLNRGKKNSPSISRTRPTAQRLMPLLARADMLHRAVPPRRDGAAGTRL